MAGSSCGGGQGITGIEGLSEPEQRLWDAFPSATQVDLRIGDRDEDDPLGASTWGPDRQVRASVIARLLLGRHPDADAGSAAVRLVGAQIVGALSLDYAEFRYHLRLAGCRFSERVWLYGARTRQLSVIGSALVGLDASLAQIDGNLRLIDNHVDGQIRLAGTRVLGDLRLDGTRVHHVGGIALDAPRLRVENDLSLRQYFGAEGQVTIRGATVGGEILMEHAELINPAGIALYASRGDFGSNVQAEGLRATGEVRLSGTKIAGTVNLYDARLTNRGGDALIARRAEIGASVHCERTFRAEGRVRMIGCKIGGDLSFAGATLINPGETALDAQGSSIYGQVHCDDGFHASGTVDFSSAHVTSTLSLHAATLTDPARWSLALWHAKVGVLDLRTAQKPEGGVNLQHSTLNVLRDSATTWPDTVILDGLDYAALEPADAVAARIGWLNKHPDGFLPQPYEQLASVYRRMGQDGDARLVLLAKQRARRRKLPWYARAWGHLQDAAVGYGYRPERALAWLFGLLVLGTIAFALRPPTPATADPHLAFNPLVYTLDLLLPVINFGQSRSFVPTPGTQYLAYVLTAAGWILATTIAAAVARAVNRS